MAMMNAGMTEAAGRTPMAGMDDNDGDVDTMVTCPECGAKFAPGDMDDDATALAAGAAPAAPGGPGEALAAPAPAPAAGGDTCPECGDKMTGGKCARCGYSRGHSPMREAATKFNNLQPEHARPDIDKVVEQGSRIRNRMRRPAPYGRA